MNPRHLAGLHPAPPPNHNAQPLALVLSLTQLTPPANPGSAYPDKPLHPAASPLRHARSWAGRVRARWLPASATPVHRHARAASSVGSGAATAARSCYAPVHSLGLGGSWA